jgi:hypothetical protein
MIIIFVMVKVSLVLSYVPHHADMYGVVVWLHAFRQAERVKRFDC